MDILTWQTSGRKMPVSLGPAGRGSMDRDRTISKVTLMATDALGTVSRTSEDWKPPSPKALAILTSFEN